MLYATLELGMLVVIASQAPRNAPWTFILSYAGAFAAYAAAAHAIHRMPDAISLRKALFPALLFRIVALSMAPSLSDDLYRYLWEGHIGRLGLSPYSLAPASHALDFLSDSIRAQVNHPEISSIYPPIAQWLFQLLVAIRYSPWSCKIAVTLFDGFTIGAIISMLRHRNLSPSLILLYAWNPLPVLEFSGSGHLDSAPISLMMLALALHMRSRATSSVSLLLAVSTLLKLFAVALLPLFARDLLQRLGLSRTLLFLTLFALSVALAYLPYRSDQGALLEGLSQYGHRWSFNGSLYQVARALMAESTARALMGGGFALLVIGLTLRGIDVVRAAFLITGCFFLLSPTAHPWYLCWTLPFLPLFFSPAWCLLSGTVVLSYSVFAGPGGWFELPWIPWLEYVPFFLVLLYSRSKAAHTPWGQTCG